MNASATQSSNTAREFTGSQAIAVLIAVPIQLAVVTCAVGLRLYTRGVLMKRYGWEDVLALISWLVVCVDGSLVMALTRVGLGHHINALSQPDELKNYFEIFWLSVFFYNVGLTTINLAILALYHRVMHTTQLRRWVEVTGLFALAWALVQTGIIVSTCRPFVGVWDKSVPAICPSYAPFWYANGAGNILIHFAILVLPIPAMRQTQLSPAQKLFLSGILSLGFLTCAISLLRIHSYRVPDDPTYDNAETALWSQAELSSGLVCACLPVLRPLLGATRRRRRRRSWRPPVPPKDENPHAPGSGSEKPRNTQAWPGRTAAVDVGGAGGAPLRPVLSRLNQRYREARDVEAAPPPDSRPSRGHVAWHMRRPDAPGDAPPPARPHSIMGLLSAPWMSRADPRAAAPTGRYAAEREVGVLLPPPNPTYFPTQAHYQLPHRWRSTRGACPDAL